MNLKQLLSGLLALVMGLFTGCADAPSDDTPSDTSAPRAVITFLQVGKADCFVIQTARSTVMIDTGTEESVPAIEAFLDRAGIVRIDWLVLTHYDRDHVGGADKLIARYDIGRVYTTSYIAKESDDIDEYLAALRDKGISPVAVQQDTTLTLDGVTWEFYPPQQDDYKKDISNNSSLVIRMELGNTSALFAGDAQKARIKELANTEGLAADILKMPHHGGFEKNLDDLLDHVQPRYAVLTDSDGEPADDDTVRLLKEYGVTAYSTRTGNIVMTLDGETVTVE